MDNYSMAQVESLTGIKGHTLRVWERRYNFLQPERTDTNIRYYSDKQLRLLLNIAILNRNGVKVSAIDKMAETEIEELVLNITHKTETAVNDDIARLTICMLEMDEAEFEKAFQLHVMRRGLLSTITEIVYPFLSHVGVLWTTRKTLPAQEHFITNLIRQKIISAIDTLPKPNDNAPAILMFLTEGEMHEIGLLLAAYIAKDLGWRVIYLGQNVPTENIKNVTAITNPDLLMTMFIAPLRKRNASFFSEISSCTDVPVLLSGNQDHLPQDSLNESQFVLLNSPHSLISFLEKRKDSLGQ
jgi:DNA-binding transcriptional MerR regulator